MPLRFAPLSQKTVFLSKRPLPVVSSRMTTRSCPSFSFVQLGYDRHSTTHMRPRSSKVNAMGCTISGSPANSVAWKPGGRVMALAAACGGGGGSWAKGLAEGRREGAGRGREGGQKKPLQFFEGAWQ